VRLAFLLVALSCAGCRTTETRRLNFSEPAEVHIGSLARNWEIRSGEELVGLLVLFEARDVARDSVYVVRNQWHQDLGMIDAFGRAFRYLPHRRDPTWVGTGTVVQGAERILEASSPCRLVELLSTEDSGARGEELDASDVPSVDVPTGAPPTSPPALAAPPAVDGGFAQSG
jgi:hypothetical protein